MAIHRIPCLAALALYVAFHAWSCYAQEMEKVQASPEIRVTITNAPEDDFLEKMQKRLPDITYQDMVEYAQSRLQKAWTAFAHDADGPLASVTEICVEMKMNTGNWSTSYGDKSASGIFITSTFDIAQDGQVRPVRVGSYADGWVLFVTDQRACIDRSIDIHCGLFLADVALRFAAPARAVPVLVKHQLLPKEPKAHARGGLYGIGGGSLSQEHLSKHLGRLRCPESETTLVRLTADKEDGVAAAATTALGQLGYVSSLPTLTELLRHDDGAVRAAAVRAIGVIDPPGAAELILPCFEDRDYGLLRAAAEALKAVGYDGSRKEAPIGYILLSRNAEWLTAREPADYVPVAVIILTTMDYDADLEGFLAKTLAGAPERSVPPLIQALGDTNDARVKVRILKTLAATGTEDAWEAVVAALRDNHRDVRVEAARQMGVSNRREAIPTLIECLQDGDTAFVEQVIDSLGSLAATQAASPLCSFMRDKEGTLYRKSCMALRAIDWEPAEDSQRIPFLLAKEQFDALPALGERALQPIIKHLKHGPDGDDVSCVRVLGELANRDAIPALVEHSKQYGADKAALLLALTKLGAVDDAKELAVQCLSNSDPSVREKSAHALSGAAGDPKITTALRERLEKEDRWFVRAALKKALGAQDSEQDLDVGEALLPPFAEELVGRNEVRIRNPNDFAVTTGVRSGDRGKNFLVPAGGVASVRVPDGEYEIYFVYSSKPDALFQGDDFQLRGNGVEIRIVKVVDGNYGIRQVK